MSENLPSSGFPIARLMIIAFFVIAIVILGVLFAQIQQESANVSAEQTSIANQRNRAATEAANVEIQIENAREQQNLAATAIIEANATVLGQAQAIEGLYATADAQLTELATINAVIVTATADLGKLEISSRAIEDEAIETLSHLMTQEANLATQIGNASATYDALRDAIATLEAQPTSTPTPTLTPTQTATATATTTASSTATP